ncbi:MAG: acyl carrier protein [Oscillospiraceae bacterium]|nr:acyl carrier protein [Oscillospiraceae bacterium]
MFEKFKELICNYVEADPEAITEDTKFIEDLGFTSYDFMSLLGDLETEFDVMVDEAEVVNLQTVGMAVDYLEKLVSGK